MIEITPQTALYGIIGDPVKHSKSPTLQNHFFHSAGIDSIYFPFQVKKENLGTVLKGFRCFEELKGFNVTVPHKETISLYLDEIDPAAKTIGAVNTVQIENGKWIGYNTDWYGVKKTLELYRLTSESSVLIIGAGGASRSVIYALQAFGIQHISITNRTSEKSQTLAASFGIQHIDFTEHREKADSYDWIINTTTLGFSDLLPVFQKETVYFDLKYYLGSPPADHFIDGKEMLLHQGARAFEIWTGQKADLQGLKI